MPLARCALGALFTLVLTVASGGQEATAEGAAPTEYSMVNILTQGGTIGFVIIGLSILGTAFIIEYFVSIRREKMIPPDLLGEIERLMDEQDYDGALDLCEQEDCTLTRVVAAGLRHMQHGHDVMIEATLKNSEVESVRLFQKISYLALLGNIGPMLGLLGTVWGMILSFNKIAQLGTPDPGELAEGISIALVTTVLGLVVAIPTMAFFFYFKNRVARAMTDVEAIAVDLLERFRGEK